MRINIDSVAKSMSETASPPPDRGQTRIVDLVFAADAGARRRRHGVGAALVVVLYIGALAVVGRFGQSAGAWTADLAARVHDAIVVERPVEVPPPPPPPPAPASPEPTATAPRVTRTARAARAQPAAPAQAAKLAAVSTDPLDFTGSAFVVGSAATYAGGTTTSTGTSATPARGNVAPGGTGAGAAAVPSRARPVSLDQAAWNCPWPAEADAQQIDQQTVVLRVTVRADGGADRVDVLSDPGFGFGAAARLCALRTRFEPAVDPQGRAVVALSPPIRVHFFR